MTSRPCRSRLTAQTVPVSQPTNWLAPTIQNTGATQERGSVFSTNQGIFMNKDQVAGAVKDAAGKVQQKTGEVIGSTSQQVKGLTKQVEGKTQKAVGDVKEVVKDAANGKR